MRYWKGVWRKNWWIYGHFSLIELLDTKIRGKSSILRKVPKWSRKWFFWKFSKTLPKRAIQDLLKMYMKPLIFLLNVFFMIIWLRLILWHVLFLQSRHSGLLYILSSSCLALFGSIFENFQNNDFLLHFGTFLKIRDFIPIFAPSISQYLHQSPNNSINLPIAPSICQ